MFPPQMLPQGAVSYAKAVTVPRKEKWAHMLPDMERQIAEKLGFGWDVAFVDGSRDSRGGVGRGLLDTGYGLGRQMTGMGPPPLTFTDRQSFTRAELTAALRALQKKCPGIPLHLVADSESGFMGLQRKCDKGSRHKWVGSRELPAHAELWQQLWAEWSLLGDSVSIQWGSLHMVGNEQADSHARKGAKAAKHAVTTHKSATDIWGDSGLQEMPDSYDTDSNASGGSCLSTDSEHWSENKRQRITSKRGC